jgi:hypothetical protein
MAHYPKINSQLSVAGCAIVLDAAESLMEGSMGKGWWIRVILLAIQIR